MQSSINIYSSRLIGGLGSFGSLDAFFYFCFCNSDKQKYITVLKDEKGEHLPVAEKESHLFFSVLALQSNQHINGLLPKAAIMDRAMDVQC